MTADRPHPIRKSHDDTVSHEDAMAAALRLINSHFHNPGQHARARIPADLGDDDIVIHDYIRQQQEKDDRHQRAAAAQARG